MRRRVAAASTLNREGDASVGGGKNRIAMPAQLCYLAAPRGWGVRRMSDSLGGRTVPGVHRRAQNGGLQGLFSELRVLIANETRERREALVEVLAELGHEVIDRDVSANEIVAIPSGERPDVSLVGVARRSERAFDFMSRMVRDACCPVIALLTSEDPARVREAARRGAFAYVVDDSPAELQSAIEITVLRYAEYHDLQDAFERRATIEQAKGILMERHSIDDERAFALLREHARRNGRKLVAVAGAIVDSHLLLSSPKLAARGVESATDATSRKAMEGVSLSARRISDRSREA